MRTSQSAESLFLEYRALADNYTQILSDLLTRTPTGAFPKVAAQVWRFGMLAEAWGKIATKLCGGKVDYIENWRTGK
jgi:hypothetical protein